MIKKIEKIYVIQFMLFFVTTTVPKLNAQSATEVLNNCIEQFGGLEQLQEIKFITKHHNGHKHWLEQSEFHNGPFITSYEEVTETYSLTEDKLFQESSIKQFQFKESISSSIVINASKGDMVYGTQKYPLPQSYKDEILSLVSYDPLAILLKAKASNNLKKEENYNSIEGEAYHNLSFTKNNVKHNLLINSKTGLLFQAEIETHLPYENFFSPFGNFTTTVKYSLYHYHQKAIRYPYQWDIYRLGNKWRSITCDAVSFLKTVDTEIFTAEKDIKKKPPVTQQKGNFEYLRNEFENVYTLLGNWFVQWVINDNEILIIEAPISSTYSKSVIDYLKDTYPNKIIKGVIVASDAYPHIGGIREYVANEIPIITHPNNKGLLEKIIKAMYVSEPDELSINPKAPVYKFVTDEMNFGKDISIYPIEGSAGSKMLMVHSKKDEWLYTADLIQKTPEGFFMPQYLTEVQDAVNKNKLEVSKVFGMHLQPVEREKVEQFILNNNK
ncbi:MAG: hypothetical protein WBA74_09355 [Cyclobacteriaceae bacterium]